MNKSNTEKVEWDTIDWAKVETTVFKLQKRIYQASLQSDVKKVRKLQRTLMRSWSNRVLSIRRVTQDNRGKKTAGVDGVKFITPDQRMEAADNLKLLNKQTKMRTIMVERCELSDKSRATRRVWIPKTGTNEKRPLGIPTMMERAKQALVKNALEPEWEALFEPSSYGFRPGRSCQDAIQHIKSSIQHSEKYVLDADISKCFDRIDHSKLLQKLNIKGKVYRQVKAWLKSGVIDNGAFEETTKGTPQGGVISPLLANIALHGMEERLKQFAKNSKGWTYKNGAPLGGINKEKSLTFIRYADDFVVLHHSKKVILECKEIIKEWLKDIGLELKPSKTRLTHTLHNEESEDGKAGFDFLGFHIQQHKAGIHKDCLNTHREHTGFKTLISPSDKAKKKHQDRIAEVIKEYNKAPQAKLILELNPIIQGWTNYYRFSDAKTTRELNNQDKLTHWKLRKWGIKRCKSNKKSLNNYFHRVGNRRWVFSTRKGSISLKLINHEDTHCSSTEYKKVKGNRSPYDGDWLYWSERMGHYPEVSKGVAILLKKQKGKCAYCGKYFKNMDIMEKDHIIPKSLDGEIGIKNLQLLHGHCHDIKTANDLKTLADSKLLLKQQRDSIEQRWLDGETNFSDEEKVLLDEILSKRYEGLEPEKQGSRFYDHTSKRKRKKSPIGNKSMEKKPKAKKPIQYIKGKRVRKQEAPKG